MIAYWNRLKERVELTDVHAGKVAFYVGVLLYLAFLWSYAREFGGSNLPKIVVYVTALVTLLGLVTHVAFAKGYVDNPYRSDEEDKLEEAIEETSDGEADDVSPVVFAKTILAIVLYTVLIPTLGFFSASFLFSSTFIFDRTRNVRVTALAAIVLTLVFYILFILILENYLLLRLGVIDRYVFETLLA